MKPHLQHKHLLVRAEVNSPPFQFFDIDSAMRDLVKKIDMKILSGPHSVWCGVQGNVGYSSTCIIETSSITFHSWMESHYPVIQLDVYSCKDFEIETVLMWLRQFDPERIDYKFLDREHNFKAVKDDTITFDQKVNYVE
jgi:S-adenosylmethionine/arginine decarboxylase-like enzyme